MSRRERKNVKSRMSMRSRIIAAAVLAIGVAQAFAQDAMPGMDHSQMDHGEIKQDSTATSNPAVSGLHGNHAAMQGGSPPPDARDPHAYSDGLVFGPHRHPSHADQSNFASLLVDRLEAVHTSDKTHAAYDLQFRYGRDYDKLVLKAEGEATGGRMEEARSELLWSHAVAAYWDTQLGVRYDSGEGPGRGWLAIGVQGLAPYWFEIDATAYVGDTGRSALRLSAEYELLLTQKLILQPRLEAHAYGQQDAERALGAGLSSVTAGIRLRYEIRREFAPYVGIEWAGKFGATADYAKAAGRDTGETRLVAGLRFWY